MDILEILAASSPGFFTGIAFGTLLLCVGLGIGLLITRFRETPASVASIDPQHLVQLLGGLAKFTHGFASDVSQYRTVIDGVSEKIRDVEGDSEENRSAAIRLLSHLAEANELLTRRLDAAEATLKEQAEEISAYVSEARTDALTGLPNRRWLDEELQRRMAEWNRHGTIVSVLLADVDHFKSFNDQYGHLIGDEVLKQVAEVMRHTMRESDLVARFGGEEFAVILPCSNAAEACQAAQRLRRAVEKNCLQHEEQQLSVTVSCGAAQAAKGESPQQLLVRADEALYAAKNAGRNCSFWHDSQECLPVDPDFLPKPAKSQDDRRVKPPGGDDNFGQVCADLRRRLQEVALQEVSS